MKIKKIKKKTKIKNKGKQIKNINFLNDQKHKLKFKSKILEKNVISTKEKIIKIKNPS